MDNPPQRRRGPMGWLANRSWRFWVMAPPVAIVVAVALEGAMMWFWPRGVTALNVRKIVPGMTKAQVEVILGSPNPGQAKADYGFWDAAPMLGFQYVSMSVWYDDTEKVARTRTSAGWHEPRWLRGWSYPRRVEDWRWYARVGAHAAMICLTTGALSIFIVTRVRRARRRVGANN